MQNTFIKKATRAALLASIAFTSGCYSISVSGIDVAKPVSLSESIGPKVRFERKFRHEFITWYGASIVPLVSVPGAVPAFTPADKLVSSVLANELRKGGDGIVNLRVTQQANIYTLIAAVIPAVVINVLLPAPTNFYVSTAFSTAFAPMSAIVEGDIVQLVNPGRSSLDRGMITLHKGKLTTPGMDLRSMLVRTAREAQAHKGVPATAVN